MDPTILGVSSIIILLILIFIGVPLAFAITLVSVAGLLFFFDLSIASLQIHNMLMDKGTSFILTSVPLFIFMGQLVAHGNVGRDLYDCVYKWFGRVPGGLAITGVLTSAGFGAVTGVSTAAVAVMASISMPEMRRHGYNMRLAAGSIATASTLAILVPPSLLMILYGLWTETSIGQLFMAGIIPAVMVCILFCTYIYLRCRIFPKDGPTGERFPLNVRIQSLLGLAPIIVIFTFVIGGIYAGIFTPSEAAGVGTFAVLVLLVALRRLTVKKFVDAVLQSAELSLMIFMIFISVNLLTSFLAVTEITPSIVGFITNASPNKFVVLALIVFMFVVMGMILDPIGMLLLALPFVFPVAMDLGFDPVWFGIVITLLVEIALVTPPLGFNCFVLNKIVDDVELLDVFVGTTPFVVLALLSIAIITAVPGIVLWLPSTMF